MQFEINLKLLITCYFETDNQMKNTNMIMKQYL